MALPEHPQEPEGEADLHGRSQGAQAVRELTELCEEVRQDSQPSEGWSPHGEVHCPEEGRHLKTVECLWGQAQLPMEEADSRDVVSHTV